MDFYKGTVCLIHVDLFNVLSTRCLLRRSRQGGIKDGMFGLDLRPGTSAPQAIVLPPTFSWQQSYEKATYQHWQD